MHYATREGSETGIHTCREVEWRIQVLMCERSASCIPLPSASLRPPPSRSLGPWSPSLVPSLTRTSAPPPSYPAPPSLLPKDTADTSVSLGGPSRRLSSVC